MKPLAGHLTLILIFILVLSACGPAPMPTGVQMTEPTNHTVAAPTQTEAPPTPTLIPTPTLPPEKNVAYKKPVRVSSSWVVDPPERAVDGNLQNWWGVGGPAPAWIEVDLEGIYSISKIKVINQGPSGLAVYQVLGRGPGETNQLLHTFDGIKKENQILEVKPETPWEDISTVRVEILNGSGWAGFREVQVYSRDEPKPLPVVGSLQPPFLAKVQLAELEPVTPDNAIFMEQLAMLGRGPANDLTWAPDGETLAVASPLGIWLYDPEAVDSPPVLLDGHKRDILSTEFSQDGTQLFSGSQDGTVKVWNSATGELERSVPLWENFSHEVGNAPRESEVWSIAFHPDGKQLAAGRFDGKIHLWNWRSGKQGPILQGHTTIVNKLAFSLDGSLLASSSVDGAIFVWNVETGGQLAQLITQGAVQSLAFSPNGEMLAYGGAGMAIRLWDTVTGEELVELSENTNTLSLTFYPDSYSLAFTSLDGTVRIWDAESGSANIFRENAGWIINMAYSPDGRFLATHAWDGKLRLWDAVTASDLGTLAIHNSPVTSVAFSPDSKLLAAGGEDYSIRLWEVEKNNLLTTLWGHRSSISGVAFSPDGKILASGSFDQTVILWDVPSQSQITILSGHESLVRCVAFSPDGNLVASGSTDTTVRLWDVASGEEYAVLTGHTGEVESVAFSSDGQWLVSTSADNSLRIWNVALKKEVGTLKGHNSFVFSAAFRPGGMAIASASGDHTVRMWNLKNNLGVITATEGFTPIGHGGWVQNVTYSPDGAMIASSNLSTTSFYVTPGEIHLYTADTGFPLALLRRHTKRITNITFSPDGKLLASGSADGSVRLWGVQKGTVKRDSGHVVPTPTTKPSPKPVGWDPFSGEWAAYDSFDGSNLSLVITRDGDEYSLAYIDDKASLCGKDAANKPIYGVEFVYSGKLQGDILYAVTTSVTCLSNPAVILDREFTNQFSYLEDTDTLIDTLESATWIRQ